MRRLTWVVLVLVGLLSGCSTVSSPGPVGGSGAVSSHAAASPSLQPSPSASPSSSPEPETAAALRSIAQTFNDEYGRNDDGPVYDRWDARSQAVISRAEYIRRHAECPTAPQTLARVISAVPGPNGSWLVNYEIGGQRLTDHWFYVGGRWVFDLLLSNPDAVALYQLPAAQYAVAVGCQGLH